MSFVEASSPDEALTKLERTTNDMPAISGNVHITKVELLTEEEQEL